MAINILITEDEIYYGLRELLEIENTNLSNLQLSFKKNVEKYGRRKLYRIRLLFY